VDTPVGTQNSSWTSFSKLLDSHSHVPAKECVDFTQDHRHCGSNNELVLRQLIEALMRSHAPSSWAWRSTCTAYKKTRKPKKKDSSTAQLPHTRIDREGSNFQGWLGSRPLMCKHTADALTHTHTPHTLPQSSQTSRRKFLVLSRVAAKTGQTTCSLPTTTATTLCNGCQSAAHSGLLLRCRQHRHGTRRRPPDPTVRCNPPTGCAASPLHTCCGELTVVWPESPLIVALHSRMH